ncbi:hypothetical protein [Prolixibacter denitrificans]|uniref:Lipoprotein n=1 Tax=Prolixibacter denitrificans TaxID=1541063 RepID=A0A2P8C8G6_9BACT|nr:hypothetical protein [Prolixibacter denitrificans]PSK81247.1 hypothetical protein CLV93_11031 [Prolixibacter denitrificans]GET21669.1 hypothetical protein JCM18694_19150 [Prolixibacter denitrificans]
MKIFLFVAVILVAGCSRNSTEPSKKSAEDESEYNRLVWEKYNEPLVLLAIKYDIDTSIVRPVFTEYLKKQDPYSYYVLTYYTVGNDTAALHAPRESVYKTVHRISNEYSIDVKVLSSFLFDLRTYNLLNEIDDTSSDILDKHYEEKH